MRVPIFMYVATQLNSVLQKTIPLETQVMIMHMRVRVNFRSGVGPRGAGVSPILRRRGGRRGDCD